MVEKYLVKCISRLSIPIVIVIESWNHKRMSVNKVVFSALFDCLDTVGNLSS